MYDSLERLKKIFGLCSAVVGSIAASQIQGTCFAAGLRLLSVQRFSCSPHVHVFPKGSAFLLSQIKIMLLGELATLNCS